VTRRAAVVFDCDGVLVDSEPHSVASWLAVLARFGHPATAADIEACIGLGYGPTRHALARLGPLPGPGELWPHLLDALEGSYRRGLMRFADAMAALDACERCGVAVAVASASPRLRLDLTLASAGLATRFPVSVAGDEVAHAKPAPDVYLRAAELLRIDPRDCLAIEDTPIGARAGVAAGMKTVAVVRGHVARAALAATGAVVVDAITLEALGLGE
jgi:beta-phosphoglucomutase-like phosphatase (HAD superfamily)